MFFIRCSIAIIPAAMILYVAYFVLIFGFSIVVRAIDNVVQLLSR